MNKIMQPSLYTDHAFFEQEKDIIFIKEPIYLGHAKMLPSIGSYIVPSRHNQDYILLRNEKDIILKTPQNLESELYSAFLR